MNKVKFARATLKALYILMWLFIIVFHISMFIFEPIAGLIFVGVSGAISLIFWATITVQDDDLSKYHRRNDRYTK